MFTNHLRGLALLIAFMLVGATASAATVTVTNNADSGAGSLRDTISAADAGDTIVFDASLNGATITLGGTQLTINKNLVIDASALLDSITISGNNASRIFIILAPVAVTMNRLKLTNGTAAATGNLGGAIKSEISGTVLTMNDCTVSNSTAQRGGAILFDSSTLNLNRCTLSGNTATSIGGALDLFSGTATLTNCTISGNTLSGSYAAGIYVHQNATLNLIHCTVTGNSAVGKTGGGIVCDNTTTATLSILNSIIAGNTALNGPDIFKFSNGDSPTYIISGANIIGNNSSVTSEFPAGPLVGTSASPLNPQLGALGNNGGPVQTMALQTGSPAIDAATGTRPGGIDQRGFGVSGAADIGAFEVQSSNANLTNLVLNDGSLDPTFDPATLTYTAGAATASLTLTPTAEHPQATITVNGSPVVSGAASAGIPLSFGAGTIVTVVVTAHDLVTTKTYTIDVTRLSDNANLTNLVLSAGTLTPAFDNATLAYTATTGAVTASLTVTPTAENAGATLTVNGNPVVSGTASAGIPLSFGAENVVTVAVTAQDEVTTKTFTLNVTRLPATTDSNGNGFSDLQEYLLGNLPSRFYVGEVISLDLAPLFYPMPSGQALAITGLPPGVSFNPTTGLISGTVLGLGSTSGVAIQIKQGSRVLHALQMDLAFEPYRPAGSYEALLEDGGLPVGTLKLTVASPSPKKPNPAYTATLLRLGEVKRSAKGSITPGASPMTVRVVFPAHKNSPAVSYDVVITNGSDLITGATVPASTVTARGFRLAKAERIPGGKPLLTMSLPPTIPGDRTTTPGGIGYAKGSVSSRALIPLSGLLGDAQSFTVSLCLSQTNQAVVWLTPYKNKTSYLGGIIDIGTLNVPGRNSATESATAGLKWARVPDATAASYPDGFSALNLAAFTSRWYSVPKAEALGQALGLTFRAIHVSYTAPTADVLPARWSLRDNLAFLTLFPTNSVTFTGKALGTNGTFSGKLQLPAPAKASAMSGIFLQDASFGSLIGQGLVKVPITAPVKGSYQTIGVELDN